MTEKIYGVISDKAIEFYTVLEEDNVIKRATRFMYWSKGCQRTLNVWTDALEDVKRSINISDNDTIEMIADEDVEDMKEVA